MHIHTNAPTAPLKRHRLYVVVPLFVLSAWVGVTAGTQGSVLPDDPVADSPVVIEGNLQSTALVAGNGLIDIVAGIYRVQGWNGVFDLSVADNDTITVAALTTPVVVTSATDTWLVPVGMQMTVQPHTEAEPVTMADWVTQHRPVALPAHYLRERLPEAERLFVTLSPDVTVDLQEQTNITSYFYPQFISGSRTLAPRALLLSQLVLPLSRRSDPLPSLVIRGWQEGWKSLHERRALTSDMLTVIVPQVTQDIRALEQQGYPARAQRLARALSDGIGPLASILPADALAALEKLQVSYDIALPAAEDAVPASAEDIPSSDQTTVIPTVSADIVRSRLTGLGFMFTAATSLVAQEYGGLRIADIVIANASGDQLLSFIFDPVAGLVSGIERDGTTLPYSLSLEKMVEWVKTK